MSIQFPAVDPDGLLEYSVVFTDRSVNHMSQLFQQAMRDISTTLKEVYRADAVAVVPGGGTYGMEAVARQLAVDKHCLVLRNGWFSYRWSQIFEMGKIPARETVMKARLSAEGPQQPFAPAPLEEVVQTIRQGKPDLVFAPHVETASGMVLPEEYLRAVGEAVHAHGGLFVLDCVASGALWVDMKSVGVDVLISAPQKGWSASPCAALVMLGAEAVTRVENSRSNSFACDLLKWLQIMRTYESGGHAYHATLPTDGLLKLHDAMTHTRAFGFDLARDRQWELGGRVRAMLVEKGFPSVAVAGFQAPGVVVSYTSDPLIHNGKKFLEQGLQTAAGVPLMCDEPADFRSFRVGLFGLDKLFDVDATLQRLRQALEAMPA
ncbi:MAG TPA: aminotransferase class V-fold PLP-dependent enzyme [Dongiaceae bacterium]|nr:aminotransferase class V-fold PLP-dependent enzyme [Dongiaceae bacterium]